MKKLFVLLTAVLLAGSLCSCSGSSGAEVNGTPVAKEIVRYYADRVQAEYPKATAEKRREKLGSELARYVLVNSEFANRSLTLSVGDKLELLQNVNRKWSLFSEYYRSVGVSKQGLQKIEANKKYEEVLMLSYYGAGGEEPIGEDELKDYFEERYIAFRSVTGFLTTVNEKGEAAALNEDEKQKLLSEFSGYAQAVNSGASLEDVCAAAENVSPSTETVIMRRGTAGWPGGFFEKVCRIEEGRAGSFDIGDCVFLVLREKMEGLEIDGRDPFETYRTSCLKALKGRAFEKVLSEWQEDYASVVR